MNKPICVCLVSNRYLDEDYIEEWCKHYYEIGFEFIYILEDLNGRSDMFIDIPYIKECVDNGKMMIEEIDHQNQYMTYPQFYDKHKTEFSWCGIFDSDEFLILHKHENINDFLSEPMFCDADVITINWKMFGDNGHLYKTDEPLIKRFPIPSSYKNPAETKIIIRGDLESTEFFIGHCCVANKMPHRTKFCNGEAYTHLTPYHYADYSICSLNHYFTKSTEEFIKRKTCGRLDIPSWSNYKAFESFIPAYFELSEKTPEKIKMFNEVLNNLK